MSKPPLQCFCLLGGHPRAQAALASIEERLAGPFQRLRSLTCGEDHFGEATAPCTIEIQLNVAQIGLRGCCEASNKVIDRNLALQQGLGKLAKLLAIHSLSLAHGRTLWIGSIEKGLGPLARAGVAADRTNQGGMGARLSARTGVAADRAGPATGRPIRIPPP